ncbi:MAG: hypothetical protein QM516_02595 [Limnohabitans sp.]|nr:hypothetical protein [Limnohabitans sp.]
MNRVLCTLPVVLLTACATTQPTAQRSTSPALGMVGPVFDAGRNPTVQDSNSQNSDSSFKGKPGDLQDSSFAGRPGQDPAQSDPNAMTPSGTGYNQKPGELVPQMGGGDVHYHNHFYGNAGYSAPVYGTPVQNGNLGKYNVGSMQAPLGTGGGGAGWYGPNYETGPTGLRQGFGVGGWGAGWGGGWNYGSGYGWGGYNGYTD